jgi:2'-5' RNA ligase
VRLFTGLSLAQPVVDQLYDLLRPFIPKIRLQWSPPENVHLTTKFLGEWPEEKLKLVMDTLERMRKPGPFSLEIQRLGLFPNDYSPRVLWAGVRAPQALAQLAHDTDETLAGIGVPREKRAYTPHLTVARMRPDSPVKLVRDLLESNAAACFGPSEVRDFHLYLSRPAPGGSKYEKLGTFAL